MGHALTSPRDPKSEYGLVLRHAASNGSMREAIRRRHDTVASMECEEQCIATLDVIQESYCKHAPTWPGKPLWSALHGPQAPHT